MKRDTVKTLAGLVVIAAIVVATFAYGNAQRQKQIKHDQDVKAQQASKATALPSASSTAKPSGSAAPTASGTTSNTAPVKSPTSNPVQGGSQPTSTPATSGQVAGAQTSNIPQTGGTGASAPLPDTGSPIEGIVGFAAVVTAWLWLRRSKRALFSAVRR